MKPLVSIIIPVYNAEKFLHETLVSVINQTYENIEIICVNDGSTDNTRLVLEKFKDKIKIVEQENRGQCAASNNGLKRCNGEYIKFLDADDIINKEHIELQLKRLNGRKDALASCEWGRFYNGNFQSAIFKPEPVWKDMKSFDWIMTALKQESDMMPGWLWLIPHAILTKTDGWDERLSLNNDFEFSIRLLLHATEVLFANGAKLYYRSGLVNNLASTFTRSAVESALLTTDLGCEYILEKRNDSYTRQLIANRYQLWIYRIYPEHRPLLSEFENRVKTYGPGSIKMEGGRVFLMLSNLFGWRIARRLQILAYWFGYHPTQRV